MLSSVIIKMPIFKFESFTVLDDVGHLFVDNKIYLEFPLGHKL